MLDRLPNRAATSHPPNETPPVARPGAFSYNAGRYFVANPKSAGSRRQTLWMWLFGLPDPSG
jgi:hypothetical protein